MIVHKSQHGFTIPELLVVMVLTLFFTTLIMSFTFDVWGQAGVLQNSSDMMVTRQNLGDTLRNRLNAASSLMNQNSIPDTHTQVPDTTDATGTSWQELHAVPQTIPLPAANNFTPVLYYEAPTITTAKAFAMRGESPYQDEFVLYLDGSHKTLMLRTLANPSVSGNSVKTSCPAAAVTTTCPKDRTLAEDVSYVSTKYFSKSGNELNWHSVIDPLDGKYMGPDFGDVEVVELTIGLKKRAIIKGTATGETRTTIRVALRNG